MRMVAFSGAGFRVEVRGPGVAVSGVAGKSHSASRSSMSAPQRKVTALFEQWGNTRWSRDTAAGRSPIGALWR